jgi:hypothetical protein
MFHSHFFHNGFFAGHPNRSLGLVSAYKVEQGLQRDRIEEREQDDQSDVERIPEHGEVRPKFEFRG